jgi:site-specific DNA recombinase
VVLTAALYARFSSDLQRATSIEDQVRVCREAALRFECLISDTHIYTDKELSGATGQRPAYQRLLAAARARAFDAIVVESQDRLWRNQGEMHNALERFAFWGIRVFSVVTGTDLTDRTGRLVASVMGWKDEAFLADLRDKVRRGMLGQVHRGLSIGGRAYGYRSEAVRDELGREAGRRRVVDSVEADVICHIFRLYGEGLTPRAIAHRLNKDHVPPPRTTRRLQGWTPNTISGSAKKALGILNNPLYAGRFVWKRSRKVRDPDTGKRVMRVRPPAEWVWIEAPELRYCPAGVVGRRAGPDRTAALDGEPGHAWRPSEVPAVRPARVRHV